MNYLLDLWLNINGFYENLQLILPYYIQCLSSFSIRLKNLLKIEKND